MTLKVGIVGCGQISAAYLELAPLFPGLKIVAVSDISAEAANKRAGQFGLVAKSPDALMADKAIDIVLNLTIPAAHSTVTRQALEAGKHVYTEKPITTVLEEGVALAKLAGAKGLLLCCAPDTFLGGAPQLARALVDRGEIGRVVTGSAHMMTRGVEHRHPNPQFFYDEGAGPVLDMGPYYLTFLVNLLGPIRRVSALGAIGRAERPITFAESPFVGQSIEVHTETTVHSTIEFVTGAVISFTASWDVLEHGHRNIELYGLAGSLYCPDPNAFGGDVLRSGGGALEQWDHPLGVTNHLRNDGKRIANYRGVGLADMVEAIERARRPRCDADLGIHVLDALQSILRAARTGSTISLTTTCDRPAALDPAAARSLVAAH